MGRKRRNKLFDDKGNEVRLCRRCNTSQSIGKFSRNPSWCNDCVQKYNKEYQSQKKKTINDKARERARSAVARSQNKGIDCMNQAELEKEIKRMFFLQAGACIYTGLPMDLNVRDNKYSVSVDRYLSSRENGAYQTHNLVLTCSVINKMKQDLSFKEFIFLCRKVTQHYENLKEEKGIDLCEFLIEN